MALSEAVLLGLVTLLVLNQVASRVPGVLDRPWAFWMVNAADLLLGVGIMVKGLPGFDHVPPVRFVVGLLFVWHIGQNFKLRADRDAAQRAREKEEILAERRRLRVGEDDEEAT